MSKSILSFLLVHLILALSVVGQDSTATTARGIGSFSIEKVRLFSSDSRVSAADSTSVASVRGSDKTATNYTIIIFRIIGTLALIIGLIYLVMWLMRKAGLASGSTRVGGGGGSMDVLEILPLGQNRNAVLFRVMDTVYLCGQTPSHIALIDKFEGQRAAELLTSNKGPSTVVHFKEAVNNFIARMKK